MLTTRNHCIIFRMDKELSVWLSKLWPALCSVMPETKKAEVVMDPPDQLYVMAVCQCLLRE